MIAFEKGLDGDNEEEWEEDDEDDGWLPGDDNGYEYGTRDSREDDEEPWDDDDFED